MLYTCGLGLIGLFTLLVGLSIDLIKAQPGSETSEHTKLPKSSPVPDSSQTVAPATPPIVSSSERTAIAVLCLALLISRATGQVASGIFVEHHNPKTNRVVHVPKKWGAVQQVAGKSLSFAINDQMGTTSLILNRTSTAPGGVAATMQRLVEEAKTSSVISNLSILNSERWDHFYPGALALYYTFDLKTNATSFPKLGLTVLCPDKSVNETDVLSIVTTPQSISEQKWDLVRIIERNLCN